jgi:hypothetical protein
MTRRTPPTGGMFTGQQLKEQAGIGQHQLSAWSNSGYLRGEQPHGRFGTREYNDLERRICIRMAWLVGVGFKLGHAHALARRWETQTPTAVAFQMNDRVTIATGRVE